MRPDSMLPGYADIIQTEWDRVVHSQRWKHKKRHGKTIPPKNKKGLPSRQPQSFLNLKSNTMKNTIQK